MEGLDIEANAQNSTRQNWAQNLGVMSANERKQICAQLRSVALICAHICFALFCAFAYILTFQILFTAGMYQADVWYAISKNETLVRWLFYFYCWILRLFLILIHANFNIEQLVGFLFHFYCKITTYSMDFQVHYGSRYVLFHCPGF